MGIATECSRFDGEDDNIDGPRMIMMMTAMVIIIVIVPLIVMIMKMVI